MLVNLSLLMLAGNKKSTAFAVWYAPFMEDSEMKKHCQS